MSSASQDTNAGPRSSGLSYQDLLDLETRPAPESFRQESPLDEPPTFVPRERYVSQEFHDLEMEKVWKKTWQMACREEQLVEVGDHVVYDIGDISILVVRSAADRIQAFHNVCLHRGRLLREYGGRVEELRCPFHGWAWKLDGQLSEIPCRWDFPHVERENYNLPEVSVGTWGGFVFINMDPECESLESFLGDLSDHFDRWPLEKRHTVAHVAKVLDCNWKIAQEAFMEAYHVVGTHPQLLASIGDANSQYDAWDNFSRALTPSGTPSPHLDYDPDEQEQLDTVMNRSLDDPQMMVVPEDMTARSLAAMGTRMQLKSVVPGVDELTDAELLDSIYYTVFPNFHPWGAYNRLVYRFRPNGNDPHRCIMEAIYLQPYRGKRPPPVDIHWLSDDEDWTCAPELGFLARVFNQDTFNLGKVQAGLRARPDLDSVFGNYQETKIRHFHKLLNRYIAA